MRFIQRPDMAVGFKAAQRISTPMSIDGQAPRRSGLAESGPPPGLTLFTVDTLNQGLCNNRVSEHPPVPVATKRQRLE